MRFWMLAATALAAAALAGCDSEQKAETNSAPPIVVPAETKTAAPAHEAAPAPATGGAPFAPMLGSGADPYTPLSPSPQQDKAIADAQKGGDKKKLAAALAARGNFRMRDDQKAGARVKYRAALSDFRKAVKLDPKNADAVAGKGQIEQIYESMGRPIPSDAECDEVSRTGKLTPPPGEGAAK